jgi:4-amino-4-deoxy-L-arabinose transferase-like glycosyltransferase
MTKSALRDAAILLAIVVAGALLRAPYLVGGLWRDEASTYFEVVPNAFFAVTGAVIRGELNPPGFFLLERVWTAVAGGGAIALKLPSYVCGLLLIVLSYLLGRRFWSPPVGWLAAIFAVVTPVALDLDTEARPYALAALLAAVVLWYYLSAVRVARPIASLVAFALAGAALAYVHYTGVILLACLAVATPYVLWCEDRLQRIGPFALAFLAMVVLYVPWLGPLRLHLATGTPWTEPLPHSKIPDAIQGNVTAMLPLLSAHSTIWLALVVGLAIALVVVVVRVARGDRGALPPAATVAVAVCVVGGATVGALLSQREPRYMYVVAPAAWLWFAALLTAVVRLALSIGRIPVRATVGTLLALALGLLAGGEVRARLRAPHVMMESGIWQLVPAAMGLARKNGALFLVVPDYLGPTMAYYVGVPANVPIHGFARWDHPELFTPQGYAELWGDPQGLAQAESAITAAARMGPRAIVLVRDHDIADRGKMEYSRSWGLIAWLRATYPRVKSLHYLGRKESIDAEMYTIPAADR